jgi:hypothetical protein
MCAPSLRRQRALSTVTMKLNVVSAQRAERNLPVSP